MHGTASPTMLYRRRGGATLRARRVAAAYYRPVATLAHHQGAGRGPGCTAVRPQHAQYTVDSCRQVVPGTRAARVRSARPGPYQRAGRDCWFPRSVPRALSDSITPLRLSSLMAMCRQEDPDIAIHFSEVPLSQQLKGMHEDLDEWGSRSRPIWAVASCPRRPGAIGACRRAGPAPVTDAQAHPAQ
jgi:hypothetical protein